MRYFLAVYETGSFSGAGDLLRADQSTVGRRIAALEQRLGAKLFDRHGRGMRATPAARGIAAQAAVVRNAVHTVERTFGGIDGELAGVVRIAATEGLAAGWLTPRLAGFQLSQPEILIEVVAGNATASLATREVDIAIRLTRPNEPQLTMQQVGTMRFGLYTVATYANIFGVPQTLDELFNHRVVDHTALSASALKPWNDIIERHPAVMYRTNSSIGYQWAIQSGFGIGILPAYTPKIFEQLIRVPIELDLAVPIWLVSHDETNHVRRTRVVLNYVRELFQRDRAEWFS